MTPANRGRMFLHTKLFTTFFPTLSSLCFPTSCCSKQLQEQHAFPGAKSGSAGIQLYKTSFALSGLGASRGLLADLVFPPENFLHGVQCPLVKAPAARVLSLMSSPSPIQSFISDQHHHNNHTGLPSRSGQRWKARTTYRKGGRDAAISSLGHTREGTVNVYNSSETRQAECGYHTGIPFASEVSEWKRSRECTRVRPSIYV